MLEKFPVQQEQKEMGFKQRTCVRVRQVVRVVSTCVLLLPACGCVWLLRVVIPACGYTCVWGSGGVLYRVS